MNNVNIKALIPGQKYITQSKYGLINCEIYIFIKYIELPNSNCIYAQFYLLNSDTITTLSENEWSFYTYAETGLNIKHSSK